ncbi:Beta-alanine transporter [Pseudolycoriella hygida]|uniref:Beta-alanine transporter n=1 Tax=Pseudolycoriella hygida TaxID=35572 RepID=A0A9Q0NC12_9DIPT|nr:Beta-alanine transporter [Pseudolycoriella hygida]
MDFDAVLSDVGSFGVYQKLIITMLLPAVLPCAFHAYSQLFIASRQPHWCRVPELEPWARDYSEIVRNLSIPKELRDGELKYSECKMFVRNYSDIARHLNSKSPVDLSQYGFQFEEDTKSGDGLSSIECTSGWNYDRRMFPNTIVMEWDLVCNKDFYTTIGLVLFGVGGLIGNYVFGYLQDYWGRRPSFFVYLFLEVVACVLSAFAWNFPSWMVFRFIVGLTVPAILASPYVLAIELVGPSNRVFCTIALNIAYSLGLVLLSAVVYLVRDWRFLSLAVSVPLLLLFSCFFVLPESPRWLIATGNYKKAAKVMKTMAKFNQKIIPNDYEEVLRSKLSTSAVTNIPLDATQSIGILDLFRTYNMRAKTLIITFIWFSNTCVYVGLSYYAPFLGGDEIWNFFLAGAVEFPTYVFLWPGLNYIGRRWILCASMVIGGVACLLTFLVQQNQTVMLILYCIGKMGISSSFVVLPLAASELYPTVVRGLGMSVSSVIGMIGPIVIPLVNHMGSNMLVLPLIIMGSLLTFGGLASLLLPETMGKPLPQTIEDGENVPLTNPLQWRKWNNTKDTKTDVHVCNVCKIEIKNLKM